MTTAPKPPLEGVRSDWKDGAQETIDQWTEDSEPEPGDDEDGSGGGASGGPAAGPK